MSVDDDIDLAYLSAVMAVRDELANGSSIGIDVFTNGAAARQAVIDQMQSTVDEIDGIYRDATDDAHRQAAVNAMQALIPLAHEVTSSIPDAATLKTGLAQVKSIARDVAVGSFGPIGAPVVGFAVDHPNLVAGAGAGLLVGVLLVGAVILIAATRKAAS